MFQKNFVQFEDHVEADVRAAAPEVRIAWSRPSAV